MVPIEACVVFLDMGEDAVLGAIECGALAWAWDIRSETSVRRLIRVWFASVACYAAGLPQLEVTEQEVLESVFPPGQVTVARLCRILTASQTHLRSLLAQGSLQATNYPTVRSGRNSSPTLERASLVNFFHRRRVL